MAKSGPYYDVGAYVGEVINQGLGESKTGTPFFYLKVKVLGTPDNEGYVPAAQQYDRTVYFYLSEKSMENTVENLKALGFNGSSLAQLDPDHAKAVSFIGNQVDLYCQHEEYNGDWKEKWNLSRVLAVQTIEPKKLRQLDALFGKSLKAVPATSSPTAAAPKPAATKTRPNGAKDYGFDKSTDDEPQDDPSDPGITDADIPF
jgi:hypothetical protein